MDDNELKLEDIDLKLALKDPTNLSELEVEEVEKAQLAALKKINELLSVATGSSVHKDKKRPNSKQTKRRSLKNFNKIV